MPEDRIKLLLNCDVEYREKILSKEESRQIYQELTNTYGIENLRKEIIIKGKTDRSDYGKIMFLDKDLYQTNKFPENIWGKTAVWSNELAKIKEKVEHIAKRTFNVCVCIYYPDGNSGVDYHSDLIAFGDTTVIPSISIGEERIFHLREKESFKIFEIVLKEGSLLIMGAHCQERYEHSLPTNSIYKKGRINLTFRQYGFSQ